MWVEMLDTYIGGIGTFPKGHKFDLAPDILQHIPEDSYKKTCAPWEEHKDTKAIERAKLNTKAKDAQLWADLLQDKADEAKQKADQLVSPAAQKQREAKKAKDAAKKIVKLAEKKNATNEIKKQAFALAREDTRKDLEFQKAQGQLMVALAEARLKQMEADDAKCEAERLARAAKAEAQKQAEEKAKAKAEAKAKKEAEAKAKAEEVMKAEAAEADAVIEAANQFAKKKKNDAELNAKADAGLKDVTGKLGFAGQAEVKDGPENKKPAAGQIDESDVKQVEESDVKQVDGVTKGQADEAGKAGQ